MAVEQETKQRLRSIPASGHDSEVLALPLGDLERNEAKLALLQRDLEAQRRGESSLGELAILLEADGGCRHNRPLVAG